MSYFDDVIEPSLYKEPRIPYEERDHTFLRVPTDATDIPWVTKDGRKMTIGDMDDGHVLNAHRLLGSRIGSVNQKSTDLAWYGFLRAEINKRGIAEREKRDD